jgi:hypothetical protein
MVMGVHVVGPFKTKGGEIKLLNQISSSIGVIDNIVQTIRGEL